MFLEMNPETILNIIQDVSVYFKPNDLTDSKLILEFVDIIKHIYLQIDEDCEKLDEEIIRLLLQFRKDYCTSLKDDIPKNIDIIHNLKKIKLPAQRTKEWYEFRQDRLTASDLSTDMDKNPYSSRNKLIEKKCGHKEPFYVSLAIKHGVKYEDVAIHIYEKRNNIKIHEYGCIPHPTIGHFGASPDGICDVGSVNKEYIGRMLEIKCPKSRVITEFVPIYYELQVQGQLEVCGLELCDYLECSIKEYTNIDEFIQDSGETLDTTQTNKEKGVIIETFNSTLDKSIYIYLNSFKTPEEIKEWETETILELGKDCKYITTNYWKLEIYSVKLIQRDKERFNSELIPEINRFWDDVLKYRKIGCESIIKKNKKKELQFLPDTP